MTGACQGTLIESILRLRNSYISEFKGKRDKNIKSKKDVKELYKKQISKVPDTKDKNRIINKMLTERKDLIHRYPHIRGVLPRKKRVYAKW